MNLNILRLAIDLFGTEKDVIRMRKLSRSNPSEEHDCSSIKFIEDFFRGMYNI